MCETDFSGYPDCRNDTIQAMARALNLGMERDFVVHTPLMRVDKAATFRMAEEIGGQPLLDLIIEETHTCYLGDRSRRHAWGYGCGDCPACRLRAEGFAKFRKKTVMHSDVELEARKLAEGVIFLTGFCADHSSRELADRQCRDSLRGSPAAARVLFRSRPASWRPPAC